MDQTASFFSTQVCFAGGTTEPEDRRERGEVFYWSGRLVPTTFRRRLRGTHSEGLTTTDVRGKGVQGGGDHGKEEEKKRTIT